MTNQQDTALLPVAQIDREAALRAYPQAHQIEDCAFDERALVQAFARHRIAAEQAKPSGKIKHSGPKWPHCGCGDGNDGPYDSEVIYDRNVVPRCPRCNYALGGNPADPDDYVPDEVDGFLAVDHGPGYFEPSDAAAEQAKPSASGEAGEVEQCDRDAARLLIEWCRLTEVSEDMLIDHFRVFRSSVIAAALAALRANAPEADEATVERVKLPRLSEKMIRAACKAHYGEDNIDGIDLTANGCNYTFRDGFKRMWKGVATALRANAIEAQAGEDKP